MKKYIKVSSEHEEIHYNPSSKDDIYEFMDLLKNAEVGEVFEVEIVKMSVSDFEDIQNDN